MRLALPIALCLCGCAVQPAKRPVIANRPATTAAAQAQAIAPGEAATLTWTTSEPTDCIVYSSPDKRFWSPMIKVNGNTAVVPVVPPQWFYVTAISDDGESLPSNTIGILGKAPAGLRVVGEHAPTPSGPWVAYAVPVYDGPMDQSMAVFRLKAVTTGGWQTVSEP